MFFGGEDSQLSDSDHENKEMGTNERENCINRMSGKRQYNPKKPVLTTGSAHALMLKMKELEILTSATLRKNRSSKCLLASDIHRKKKGCGSSNSAIIEMDG